MQLNPEETTQLLYEALKAYDTEINDLLLSALGIAIKAWTGQNKAALMLESHGRQNDDIKLEVDRTIGWFTSMYPILLTTDDDLGSSILSTKEMLRQIPNHGCGYSVLKYSRNIPLLHDNLNISFNYLGHLNETTTSKQIFTLSSKSCGSDFALENQLPNSMVISGKTSQGCLSFSVFYQDIWTADAMEEFLACYKDALIQVTKHCLGQEQEAVRTNLDFGLNDMQLGEIANLNKLINNIQ
jgi:surfactin family lipopeptide synthetase A